MDDKGRKITQKDPEKGNATHNYRPIACLPLLWKLLTSVLVEKVYAHLPGKNVLLNEQMRYRKQPRETATNT